jgi:hypothetical protein
MNEDLWYTWKASLVPHGVQERQFENRWASREINATISET